MPMPGHYRINYTSSEKGSFVIEPYRTDGSVTPTNERLDSKAVRASTSLLLYGKGVPGYGERIAENFVHLLENFAGPVEPSHPTYGQLWFDTGAGLDIISFNAGNNEMQISGDHADSFNNLPDNTFKTRQYDDESTQTVTTHTKDGVATYNGSYTVVPLAPNQSINPDVEYVWFNEDDEGTEYNSLRVYMPTSDTMDTAGSGKWVSVGAPIATDLAPTTATTGQLWYDTLAKSVKVYNGTNWVSASGQSFDVENGTIRDYLILDYDVTTATPNQAASKGYVDDQDDKRVLKSGDTMTGALVMSGAEINMGNNNLVNLKDPTVPTHAANKKYVDAQISGIVHPSAPASSESYIDPDTGESPGDIIFNIPDGGHSDGIVYQSEGTGNTYITTKAESGFLNFTIDGSTASHAYAGRIRFQSRGNKDIDPNNPINILELRSSHIYADQVPTILIKDVPTAQQSTYSDQQAATHAYVQWQLDSVDVSGAMSEVTGLTYAEQPGQFLNPTVRTISLTQSNGAPTYDVDVSHIHPASEISVTYSASTHENEHLSDDFGSSSGVTEAIISLDQNKVSAYRGIMVDSGSVLKQVSIDSFNNGSKTIVVDADLRDVVFTGDSILLGEAGIIAPEEEYTVVSVSFNATADASTIEVLETLTVGSNTHVHFPAFAQFDDEITTKKYVDQTNNVTRTFGETTNGQMTYTTPTYRVGSDKLWVYIGGMKVIKSIHYNENGSSGDLSTSITFINTAPSDLPGFVVQGQASNPWYEFIVMGQEYNPVEE